MKTSFRIQKGLGVIFLWASFICGASGDTAPTITSQSPNRTVPAGSNVSISVTASGTAPFSFQWALNGTKLPERTSSFFTLSNVQPTNSGVYSVLITNAFGQAETNMQLLVTNAAPYLVQQPFVRQTNQMLVTNPVVPLGGSVLFETDAKGSSPLRFQWRFNGANIPNATNTTLALSDLRYDQTGIYTVAVSNAFGETISAKSFLNVVQVFAWGDGFTGNTNTPVGLTNAIAIAAGGSHVAALRADGTVRVWLANSGYISGSLAVTNIPSSATNIVAIKSGPDHIVAMRSNGTVVAWGGNANGQTNVPANLSNVVAVAAGPGRSFAIKLDGTVVGWGTYGTVPSGLSNVVAITAATSLNGKNFAIQRNSTVVTWPLVETVVGTSNIIAVAGGSSGFLGLKRDGTLWNSSGRISLPQNLSNFVGIAAGTFVGTVLKSDGSVVASGIFGKVPLPSLSNVAAIEIGGTQANFGVALIGTGAPAITLQPVSQLIQKGDAVQLHARAASAQPMNFQWQLDGFDIPGATNGSLILTNAQGRHTGSYRMLASNAPGSVFSAPARLIIPFNTNLPVALNATNLVWLNGTTNAAWFAQIQETHDGDAAAQSGGISHNQQSQLQTTVTGPGTLTFWWKVSSEAGYDHLRFHQDNQGIPLAMISGEVGWEKKTFSIPQGNHVLRWTYSKDGTVSSGRDAGFVDEVAFVSLLPKIVRHPFDRTVSAGANVTIPAIAESSSPMTFQWLKNGTNLSGATAQYLTLTNVTLSDAGIYALKVSSLYGSVTSSNAVLTVVAPPKFLRMEFLPDGSALLSCESANGQTFEIQASTNVQDWVTLPITPTLTNGSLMFHDTNSRDFPMRFYRIVEY